MRIGLMGGTFDPPHLGHVVPVEDATAEFSLDRVYFIPTYIPPHKGSVPVANGYHRAAMLSLALMNYPNFLFSPSELLRAKTSYTIETLEEWRGQISPQDKLYFILGSDSFLEIETWREYGRLLSMSEFIIINRGARQRELTEHLEKLQQTLQSNLKNSIHFASSPHLPVSSTEIRERIRNGQDVSSMITREVESYIRKHSLYSGR